MKELTMNKFHRFSAEYRSLGTLLHTDEVVLVFLRDRLIVYTRGDWGIDARETRFVLSIVVQVRNSQGNIRP